MFKRNGKLFKKISEHIGQFPLVMVSPYDNDIIYEEVYLEEI